MDLSQRHELQGLLDETGNDGLADSCRRRDSALTCGGQGQWLRLLLDNMTDHAVIMLDKDAQITFWNAGAEQLWGYSEAEALGQHFSWLFSPEAADQGSPEQELQAAMRAGRAAYDHWHTRKDGGRFWGSGVITAVSDDALRGYACTLRDLTARKSAHDALLEREAAQQKEIAELQSANRQQVEFLAMLSHEIRNPLAPLLAAAQVLQHNAGKESLAQQQARGVIERQVRQLKHLVDDLLDTSRLSAGKLQIRTQQVELRTVLERAVESARPCMLDYRHELTLSLGDERLWLQADPARLEQIFLNLLNNAARYTEPGGQIRLNARREGEHAIITVGDNGIGIPTEMLAGIFDMFTQVDDPAHHGHEGLGIGLTLVKRLTEMHGGSIAVRSNGPLQGSEFTVRLPLSAKLAKLTSPADCNGAERCSGLKVLIADDNRDTATMLRIILKNWGNDVRAVHDGQEALTVAASLRPDAMLIDLGMPKIGGCDVARQLRQQPWARGMLLIAATGWGQDEDKRRTTEAGFDYHLTKPFELAELQKLLVRFQHKDAAR